MSTAKHKLLILGTFLLLALATALRLSLGTEQPPVAVATMTGSAQPALGGPAAAKTVDAAAASGQLSVPFKLALPELEVYREQGRRNHHGTPRVMVDFAHRLAAEMERAFASDAYADALFGELQRCALGPSASPLAAARAMCAVNAGRLNERDPKAFQARYESLRHALPEDVSDLAQAMGY